VLQHVRDGEVIRYFVLSSYYRGPIDYAADQLVQADAALGRIYTALRDVPAAGAAPVTEYSERFREAMDDDFNTPDAIAALQTMTRAVNSAKDRGDMQGATRLVAELRALASVLGLAQLEPEQWFRKPATRAGVAQAEAATATPAPDSQAAAELTSVAAIEQRIALRNEARKRKDFKEADRIRDELAKAGVILEDRPGGKTDWRRA